MVTRIDWRRAVAGLALVASAAGCHDLAVSNTNAPERERAFSDPATIISSASGTIKTYVNMRNDYSPPMTLTSMADSYEAAWNNFNMRYYNSYGPTGGANCPDRCGWVNSTATQLGDQVEPFWYGSYSVLSSANDALFALRVAAEKPDLGQDEAKVEVVAQMTQAMAIAWIALNYDQGFIVLEDSDILNLQVEDRAVLRDKAIELFEKGIDLAHASTFTTGASWFGIGGPTYTNLQLAKWMRSQQAELLAHYPRNAEEDAQVDWAKVAEYASKGVSSTVDGPAFDMDAYVDETSTFYSGFQQWSNDYGTVRVDTRVARLLSTTQVDPFPGGAGNPVPHDASGNPIGGLYGVDKRLGDGCFDAGTGLPNVSNHGECAETPLSGTDFAWAADIIQNPARGAYHQSNTVYIRNHCLAFGFPDCPNGNGPLPLLNRAFNDLLWAEALLRTGGSKATAATLINNTRVTRGGLPPVTAATSNDDLLKAIAYEQDVELIQFSGTQYFNRRRQSKSTYSGGTGTNKYTADLKQHFMDPEGPWVLNPIWKDTPRHMPIPAKDLALLLMEIYTFGGPDDTGGIGASASLVDGSKVRSVRQIYAEIEKASRQERLRRRLHF
jgi:hypothetical protein